MGNPKQKDINKCYGLWNNAKEDVKIIEREVKKARKTRWKIRKY